MGNASTQAAQALVVVDMQRAFVTGDSAVPAAASLVRTVGRLIDRARAAGSVVIHLQNDGAPGSPDEPDTPGWRLFFAAQERESEHVIHKTTDDGFQGTELASILEAHTVREVAVCGVMSEMCVSATARSAMNLGWQVVLAHDAHATYDIPAVAGLAGAVPHAQVSRVAEWALGDAIITPAIAADIEFEPPATKHP